MAIVHERALKEIVILPDLLELTFYLVLLTYAHTYYILQLLITISNFNILFQTC
jgi:hypothetical protein